MSPPSVLDLASDAFLGSGSRVKGQGSRVKGQGSRG